MKKVVFIFLSAVLLSACKGPMGPQGPVGPQGAQGEGVNWKIVDLNNVGSQSSPWDYSNFKDNNYYFAKFDVPALTSFVFSDGNVNGYILLNENGQTIQHSLPYVLHKEMLIHNNETNQDELYFYTETVDFDYGIGFVMIKVRDSDFAYEDDVTIVPDQMSFRIVMTY